jgi:probable phosphoglycerate mutase
MKLYFTRHGESEANLLQEFSNRGFKHGLSVRGLEQAQQLAENLRGARLTRAFSSPLKRAVQTAEIVVQALALPLEITDTLREYDCGVLEGRSDAASWAIYERVSQQWERGDWAAAIPGGESLLDMRARFLPFIAGLPEQYPGENILLVGHGGLFRMVLPLLLANANCNFFQQQPMQHTIPIVVERRNQLWVCQP